MRSLLLTALCCLALGAGALPAQELYSGVSRDFRFDPTAQPRLVGNVTFQTPAGSQWAIVEAITESPDQDVDLYVRFGQPVERLNDGSIVADFRSETLGGPDEHVFISPTGAPPLQNGLYFVALVIRSLNQEIRLTLKATIPRGGAATTRIISTFDDLNDEGWTRNFPGSGLPGTVTGDPAGNIAVLPEGFLRITDFDGPNRDYAVAPPKFLGNLAGFSDPYFEYDFRQFEGPEPLFPLEIRLLGASAAFQWRGDLPPRQEWVHVHVPLSVGSWKRLEGSASFTQVLANVQRIEVSMDHAPGAEASDLDNFRFSGGPLPPPTGPGGPDYSDFETGVDGWSRNFPASAIPWASFGSENAAVLHGLGGNDSEGFLLLVDGGGRNTDFAVAPEKFIRGLADLDRPWYEFEFRRFEGAFPQFQVKLRMLGNGAVYEWDGIRPREMWDRYRVPIDAQNWVHVQGPKDFDAMLRSVQRLELSMDFSNGFEVAGLDNFRLRTQYTPPVGPALHLDRNAIEVSVASPNDLLPLEDLAITATGAEVDWRAAVEPADADWLSLTGAAGRTPDQTQILIDPERLGPGVHTAEVVVTATLFGVPAVRLPVTLVIGADPRVPVLNPGGAIHAANPAVSLSPGALGSLFGVFLSSEWLTPGLSDGRLPTSAGGVELRLLRTDGSLIAPAPLVFLSPGQINFQTPYEVAGETAVQLELVREGVASNRISVSLADAAPGVFPINADAAAVTDLDGRLISPENPASAGAVLTVYYSGGGVPQPPLASGQAAPAEPLAVPMGPLRADVEGRSAEVLGAALSPGFVGLEQLSLRLPQGLSPGRAVLRITVAGRVSNGVPIWVR
ncbi:MAG: hypothetical protein GC160_11360 [Acidobacteria bacterium]|nr:hypothetical protein [Acidobacteriota bacterium]